MDILLCPSQQIIVDSLGLLSLGGYYVNGFISQALFRFATIFDLGHNRFPCKFIIERVACLNDGTGFCCAIFYSSCANMDFNRNFPGTFLIKAGVSVSDSPG